MIYRGGRESFLQPVRTFRPMWQIPCNTRKPGSPPCALRLSADVEDMTLKSYSFNKFAVFVRMLLTSLRRTSDSVSLDLLTSDDLERVKARRCEGGGSAVDSSLSRARKRYLILTYTAEYDRVQYPLPLQLEEQPDVHRLQVRHNGIASSCVAHITRTGFGSSRAASTGNHKEAATGGCGAEGSGQRPGSRRMAGAQGCCRAAPWRSDGSHKRAHVAARWHSQ